VVEGLLAQLAAAQQQPPAPTLPQEPSAFEDALKTIKAALASLPA
jgi:hypothetical protein